jgi:ABC-2 type transport system ATP-binding protein
LIEVEGLSKQFAGISAVSSLTFSIQPGEIVGFLGQNGAGKSTTLRILSGYLPPSSGRAKVMGFDVEAQRDEARARIGYLPESVPLYPELRVREYLRFRAQLKEVKQAKQEVERVMQKTSLTEHKEQLIGTLSKGFRQRVGLADALLQNPPILLLDEPTEGLDPSQINATRGLIQELSKEHTVLLSTHILPEVERLCSRVILIHKGKLVADLTRAPETKTWSTRGTSQEKKTTLVVSFYEESAAPSSLQEWLSRLPGVEAVSSGYSLVTSNAKQTTDALLMLCIEKKLSIRELRAKEGSSLEELFLSLTTRESSQREGT